MLDRTCETETRLAVSDVRIRALSIINTKRIGRLHSRLGLAASYDVVVLKVNVLSPRHRQAIARKANRLEKRILYFTTCMHAQMFRRIQRDRQPENRQPCRRESPRRSRKDYDVEMRYRTTSHTYSQFGDGEKATGKEEIERERETEGATSSLDIIIFAVRCEHSHRR